MNFYTRNKKNIEKILKSIILIAVIYLFLMYLGVYFAPFIFGYILCIILNPVFKTFNNLKISKPVSSILAISFFIFIVFFLGIGIIGQIIKEGKDFVKEIPYYMDQFKLMLNNIQLKILSYLSILPDSIEDTLLSLYENSKYFLSEFLGDGFKNTSVQFIKKIPNVFMVVIIGIISCFFMLMDKENIEKFILRQFSKEYLEKAVIVKDGISKALMGYIKAQLIIMSLIGIICFIGLSVIEVKYALFIGFIIGIVDALPVFGSGFIIWPWCIYNLIIKNYGTSIGLIIIYVIILVTRQFIEPKILGKQIGIHPLATLMAIYIGLKVFGVFGFIIGPSILVVITTLQKENLLPNWK